MKCKFICLLLMLGCSALQAQTLEECWQAAERNYPLIKQYDLIEKTTNLTVSNIQKAWLPQVSASAQVSYQSDVTSWPDEMRNMMTAMGLDMKGLAKDQYRLGIDINQTVFDGGIIAGQKRIAEQQGKVEAAQTEVNIYNVRKRVNEMYFSLLLLDEQLLLNRDLQELLSGNEKKLASMVTRGTAAESDYLSVKAERLNAVQQATTLESQKQMLAAMLSAFCGIEVKAVQKPGLSEDINRRLDKFDASGRPEMQLFNAQHHLAKAQEKALGAALMPKISVFAQGFYGYPGLNLFEDMMSRKWSLNGLVGAKLTWNIGALYTRKNDLTKLAARHDMIDTERDVFLFNNKLEQMQQNEEINRYRKLMDDDEEIISLRSSVRKAAESKLSHGIIDVNDLVREINQENAAKVQKQVHEIQMLKEIYNNKVTTNK